MRLHAEHILLLGIQRLAVTSCAPYSRALYSNWRRNSRKPMTAMCRASFSLTIMARVFKSSMPIIENSRTSRVVVWCNQSARVVADQNQFCLHALFDCNYIVITTLCFARTTIV